MLTSDSIDVLIRCGRSKRANAELRLPARYRGKALSDLVGRQREIEIAREAIAGGKGVYLFGPPGTGKTHFAVGLLCEWYASIITKWYYAADRPPLHKRGAFLALDGFLIELKNK
jgi:hypothetical protein